MKNTGKLVLVAMLLCAAIGIAVAFWNKPLATARQKTTLTLADCSAETQFAVEAITLFAKKPREFGKLWDSHGDIYESACRQLKSAAMKNPVPVAVFRRGSDERKLTVTLKAENGVSALVEIRKTEPDGFKIVDIIVEQ